MVDAAATRVVMIRRLFACWLCAIGIAGCTPTLSGALMARDHGAPERVLDRGESLGSWNSNGGTPLHYAVVLPIGNRFQADPDAIRMLIAHGADVNAKNKNGETPLHKAAEMGEVEALRVLLEHGAAVDARTVEGATPLHMAAKRSSVEAVEMLLAHGADPKAQDNTGKTPLHRVAESGCSTDVLALLVSRGANIEAIDRAGKTPLHSACSRFHVFLVPTSSYSVSTGRVVNGRMVVDSVDSHSSESDPRVEPGEFDQDVSMTKALLSRGAAVNSLTTNRKTPLDLAEDINSNLHGAAAKKIQSPLVAILEAAGGRRGAEDTRPKPSKRRPVEDVAVDPSKAIMDRISLAGEPARGPASAKVIIVEYSDFQCPFCGRGYATIENQVLKEYGAKVRFFYKHYPLPFHPWAESGAIAVECAKEQKPEAYWKLYSTLFENQRQITLDTLKEKATGSLAGTGIDMAKWTDCFDNKKTLAKVNAQMQEGASVGVQGTPGFIINGRLVSGAQPFEAFKNIIDDELASAK